MLLEFGAVVLNRKNVITKKERETNNVIADVADSICIISERLWSLPETSSPNIICYSFQIVNVLQLLSYNFLTSQVRKASGKWRLCCCCGRGIYSKLGKPQGCWLRISKIKRLGINCVGSGRFRTVSTPPLLSLTLT